MIAEILATGDEIRSGSVIDTNTSYIAVELERVGVFVSRHDCVGDDRSRLNEVLQEISMRADIAVVTGGLGPTSDDITALAAADAAGVPLIEDQHALDLIAAYFKKRNRSMNPSSRKMALLPKGSGCIRNDAGTAPGFFLRLNRCDFYFLPGVPHEMEFMLANEVIPRILKQKDAGLGYYPVKTISTFGLAESQINERLKAFDQMFAGLTLGFRPVFPEVLIKIYGKGDNPEPLDRLMEDAVQWIAEKTGDHLLSPDGDCMEKVVGDLLIRQKATLAVAESCTGGLISDGLTDIPGSSAYFRFSAVTYSNDAKVTVLGVSPETIEKYGAVHEETARQMAVGTQRVAGAVYGISTTGIAGPEGGSAEKPVGTVCIGLAAPGFSQGLRFYFSTGERRRNKRLFAAKALDLLRRELLKK